MVTSDYHRIVDGIQSALIAQANMSFEAVKTMSSDYASACEEVNRRLRECQDLLRRGLRGQAIQRGDIEPKLIEALPVIDFPELPRWLEILSQLKLPPPPPLLYEAASELNEAYAKERPLFDLLRKHRILALGRAPLRDRITVLRQIAKKDAETAIWQDDLREWEKERQAQIVGLAARAVKQENAESLSELVQELKSSEWLLPPAANDIQRISADAKMILARRSREEMKRLERELTAAHQEFDVERGRRVRTRWEVCAALAVLPAGDPIAQAAEPGLAWLAQADAQEQHRNAYEEAVGLLVKGLNDNMPPASLERRYHAVMQLGDGIDAELQSRYQKRMDEFRLAVTRKHRLMLSCMAAAFLVIVSLAGFFIYRSVQSQALASNAAAIEHFINQGSYVEAEGIIKQLETEAPHFYHAPAVQKHVVHLAGIRQRDSERRAAFIETLKLARTSLEDAQKTQSENPNRNALITATEKAVGDGEKNEVAALVAEYDRYVAETARKKVEAFLTQAGNLDAEVARIEKGEIAPHPSILLAVQSLKPDADLVVQKAKGMPVERRVELAAQAAQLQNRLAVVEKKELEAIDRAASLQQITDAVGTPTRFRDALANYQRKFNNDRRSEDFRKVQDKEPTLWVRIDGWNSFATANGKLNVVMLTPSEATKTIADIMALATDHVGYKGLDELLNRVPYAQSVAARQPNSRKLVDDLNFTQFAVANLFYVRLTDTRNEQQNYYSTNQIVIPNDDKSGSFNYLLGTEAATGTKAKSFKALGVVKGAHGEAPQSAFSRRLFDDTRNIKTGDWEQVFKRLIPLLQKDQWMDPIVKFQLLYKLIQVAGNGSSCMQESLQPQLAALESDLDVGVNWIDPLNEKAPTVRRQAENLLQRMPLLDTSFSQLDTELVRLSSAPSLRTYAWIGWLCHENDDRWSCRTNLAAKDISGELCVVSPGATDAENRFDTIGKMEHGVAQISTALSSILVEGRPIYLVKTAP